MHLQTPGFIFQEAMPVWLEMGGKHQRYSDRKQPTVWEYNRPKASREHPRMKLVALMACPIQNSSMSNSIVLYPFLGLGATLIAAE